MRQKMSVTMEELHGHTYVLICYWIIMQWICFILTHMKHTHSLNHHMINTIPCSLEYLPTLHCY